MHRTGSGGAGPSTGPRKQRILPHPSTLIEVTPDDEILFRGQLPCSIGCVLYTGSLS